MEDDETKLEFENRIAVEIKKQFPSLEGTIHIDLYEGEYPC